MSALVLAELASSCAALGRREARARRYLVSASSAEAARELVRFLHRDGPEHEVRRQLGRADVLQTDLAPLLQHHAARRDLFGLTLRLLINLTNPALALYNEEVPVERSARHNYLEILSHLQKYKAGVFTTVDFWKVLAEKLVELLQTDWKERDDDTSMMIERILILIRNVLHVPADEDDTRPDNDASVHDQVLWALNQSGMLDVIQYMCSENERQYFMHILEIISLLLREQNPTSLASAALQRSVDEKVKDEQELLSIRMSEMKQRNDKVRQFSASRHSRFGGTYVVQNMKSISENDVICLKPLNKISNLDFGGKKEKLKRPKNRRPVESESVERRSSFSVRLVLKQFCEDFLNCSYNPLMHYVRDALVRSKGKQNDESYYLWALKFFMEFNRGNNFNVGLVSETMSVQMFHYVQLQMEKYFDMIKMEKKKGTVWVKRLHLALRAYKELLNTLTAMDKSGDESVRETAKVLKSNIFYVLEYREFMITTFLLYNDAKMPRSYLVDLVETTHLFLKMLEHFCKKTGLVVQKKLRKKSKKKKSNKLARAQPAPAAPVVPHWEEVRPQIAAVLTMSGLPHPPPFDAASDTPIDEQRAECIKNIQKLMMESKYEESIGMLRAAREVWPEEGIFGVVGIPEDEELNMLENIYVAELEVDLSEKPANPDDVDQLNDEDDNDEEDEEGPSTEIAESDFNFLDFAYRFCNPSVTSACSYLLEEFDKNLPHTNHCALKLLHRTAWDCQLPSMMFQASLFRTFQRILALKDPRFKELEKFAIFILRKFVERAASEPKLFLELLFWKKVSDAKEIEHGYAKYGETENSKSTAWSEEQEEELRKLYMENQTNPQTDQDVIDWIQENLIDQTRTRRSVIKKLKELGLIFRAPTKKSNARPKVPVEFTEEEDDALRNLWEKYGDTSDPMSAIINRMPMKRKKQQLVERLLELAIIQDKRQCRKKKDKKSGLKSAGKSSDGSDNDDSHSDSENDNEDSHSDSNDGRPSYVKQRRKKPDAAKPRTQKAAEASVTEIAKILIEAVDTGLSDALSWLADCLEEVALDQEAEGFDPTAEGVPLVPISSESVQAMESELFKQVLTKLGVEPPSDEQEIYWRIPSSLSFQTLRKRKEVILRAIEKTLIVTEETSQSVLDTPNIAESTENVDDNDKNNDSSDEDVFSNLRKIREATRLTEEPILKSSKYRKRTRSVDSDENDIRRGKIHKIDEVNSEGEKSEEDDMLSFAKKTLPAEDMPNTEDFFNNLLENIRSDIETESVEQMAQSSDDDVGVTKKGKKRRIIDDDSE